MMIIYNNFSLNCILLLSQVTLVNSQEMQALKSNPGVSQHRKPQMSSEAFPALSSTSAPATPPQWITISKSKEKPKPTKPDPPLQPREPSFNPVADFPTLPPNKSKAKKSLQSQTILQQYHPPPTIQTDNKISKKDKKKQNNPKKENSEPTYVNLNGLNDKFSKQQIREAYNVAVNDNNNQVTEADKKIKTVDTSTVTMNSEKKANGGNGDFALAAKDYPPLNPKSSNSVSSKKMPNGNVPPGFSQKTRPACDGMTFTNSAGQTFPAPVHSYIPPPDFEQRNRALVNKFAEALGGAVALENFKVASRAFRDNILNADEFYQHCKTAMGPHFESLFTDLVALLPDIAKQQELMVGRNLESCLEVCATCGQLVAPGDRASHESAHWPPLAPH